jgi:hypothetical protein
MERWHYKNKNREAGYPKKPLAEALEEKLNANTGSGGG